MRGVKIIGSRLTWMPLVALLSLGGCFAAPSNDQAFYELQSQMGWNPEMQAELKKQMEAAEIVLVSFVMDSRTARSAIAGAISVGIFGHHHY